jgi:integrase
MSVSTRKSDGQVFVQWRENGKVRRKYFGLGSEARGNAEDFSKTVTQTAPTPGSAVGVHFVELANYYMLWKKPSMSEVSFSNAEYKLSRVILPLLGSKPASRIDHRILDHYVAVRSTSVKMTTIHRELSDVRAILNWAVRRNMLTRNPMDNYDMPTRDDAVIQPPSQEEIEKIISCSNEHLQRSMLLAYFCGMRPGAVELLSIRYSQVNWSANAITIISALKGGSAQREIPIHPALPLRAWYEKDGCRVDQHIIHWNGKPIKSLKTAFNAAKRRAGVSDRKIPLYSLRHAFVTTLIHSGIDIHTIANISGHDVRTMLKHYAHVMGDVKVTAINALPELSYTAPTECSIPLRGKAKSKK